MAQARPSAALVGLRLRKIIVVSLLGLLAAASPACRDRGRVPPEPSEASLRPYDFGGHTRLKLRRLCDGAGLAKGSDAARRHLRCGLVLLDWFLLAVLREDQALLGDLARFLGGGLGRSPGAPQGDRILAAIASRLQVAAQTGAGSSIAQSAAAGLALVELQRVESGRWGYEYLRGLAEAALPGSPLEAQARVIIAGAALDGLKTAAKAAPTHRSLVIVQGLGYSCPAEAESARGLPDLPRRGPSCPLSCPELESSLGRSPPDHRKALVAAKCPLDRLGLSHREHGVYLSRENLLVCRAVAFQLQNLRALEGLGRHPLVESITGALVTLRRRLHELRVPLGLPELSIGEPVHLQVPLCASAEDPIAAPVVLVLDETRLFASTLPVLAVQGDEVTFLDWREGLGFPGRQVEDATLASLTELVAEIREVSRRLLGPGAVAKQDRVAIYGSSDLSAGRLGDLLDHLSQLGVTQIELVLRNTEGDLRAVPAMLGPARRGEGPKVPPPPSLPAQQAPLQLTLGPDQLHLRAATGPLFAGPLTIPAGDLAGLREALEKTRRAYRDASGVEIRLHHAVPYRDVARLLHHLRRSSSGRVLYATLIL